MTATEQIEIAGRRVGPDQPPYVIAELSANHNGSFDRAMAILEASAKAGADAVKLQTYTADTITIKSDRPEFRIESGPWAGRTLHDLYHEAHTPWDWHGPLIARGRELGVSVFSSPFDFTAVDYLETLDVPAFKIASFEIVDLPLIERAAATGKPLIVSTGMATPEVIDAAVDAARAAGCRQLVLLYCISGYPTPLADADMTTIPDLSRRTGCPVGLSDHTVGTTAATVATALGAPVIEKHVTLARADGGPDSGFSMEPDELAELVRATRDAWTSLGRPTYELKPSEADNRQFRRSLYVVQAVRAGEPLTPDNVRSIRPANGLPPRHYHEIVAGRRAARDIPAGTPLSWDLIAA
jgi:N-acetylneuraminate synthase